MKTEIKTQWVADLRSGKFPQTTGCLKDTDGWCCLGVLSEQAKVAGIVTERDGWFVSARDPLDNSCNLLPEAVYSWAGLPGENPVLLAGETLAELNDDETPFSEIADLIEKYL